MHTTRIVLTASFLGLFGFAGLFANYGASRGANLASKKKGNPPTMSNSASTLLTRNLNDVFGENDPVRRRKVIDEIWNSLLLKIERTFCGLSRYSCSRNT